MADTTFTAQVTKILAAWLQDVNDLVYRGIGTGGPATPFLPAGTGAVARTVQAKIRAGIPISIEDFDGGPAASAATNDTAIAAAIAALPSPNGGIIEFEAADSYNFATNITWSTKRITLQGKGSGIQAGQGTRLVFPAGVVGINPKNGSSGYGARSAVRHLRVQGADTTLGTNDGILVQANGTELFDVIVDKFGRHGVHILSELTISDVAINANNCKAWGVRVSNNYGDGWKTRGVDSNAGVFVMVDSSSNGGWGFYEDAFLGNTYISPHENGANTSGGYRYGSNGSRARVLGGYKENSATAGVQIDNGNSGYNNLDFLEMADSVTDNSISNGNRITWTASADVTTNRISVGNATHAYALLNATGLLLDWGATLVMKNVAQDAIWQFEVNASKQLSVVSAQAKALLLGNALQMSSARLLQSQGAAVASASEITLGAAGNRFQISGTTNIDRIDSTDWAGGSIINLHFQGSLTVNHATANNGAFKGLRLAGAANFAVTAADQLTLQYDGVDLVWYELARAVI